MSDITALGARGDQCRAFYLRKHAASLDEKLVTNRRQAHVTRAALKKHDSQLFLESLDMLRQRRLSDSQPFRCTAKMQGVR
ncbi:hypothetical protein A9R05_43660 (plasmid) [Burkholderia sp. KK1]|nr:hypothetical protein A9R05_43660 [Burkholderia sp. KK1]